eukprot:TRINITY_DN3189_c0_g1_i3.p2 TRINITY_DN3189_c0_g1~~TRINITY_DN3189_c0_g1_i3.p2  ORF type:complete len:172 (-),score=60.62 TRINITY_DN3189_c0_g1_i3:240-755(-)
MAAHFHEAARTGDAQWIAEELPSHPQWLDSLSSNGWTAVHGAIIRNKVEVIRTLVDAHADVDKPNLNFLYPIFSALSNHKNHEVIELLVTGSKYGVDLLRKSHGGQTVVEKALSTGCEDRTVKMLQAAYAEQQAEVEAEKAEKARKRKEASEKRKAEREAGGGKKKKKKKK